MGFSAILLKITSVILVLKYVSAQEMFDDKNKDTWGHLKKVPRKFELRAENAVEEFKKTANDIQDLAAGRNLTIVYRIKVDVQDNTKKLTKKRKSFKKIKSKKYNIPLKRQSMKLSNFEVLLRKLAEENGQKNSNHEMLGAIIPTVRPQMVTTRQMQMKYKPVIRLMNFTKVIKPVRNKIITLTV